MVGASAAVAAEVAVSLLLYGGLGFVRSLTTVLAVEGLAFAAGLWSSPTSDGDLVDRVRRRWLLCLFAFLGAALYGTAWSVFPALSAGRLGQGVGLALLGAVPIYGTGAVLGGMAALARTDVLGRLRGPGTAAAVGAALGFVLTGLLLPRVPIPASLIIGCMVMLSLGGMVYGGVLASRTEVDVLARRPGRGSETSVRERRRQADEVAVKELLEGSVIRRSEPIEHGERVPWDVAVVRALLPGLAGASTGDDESVGPAAERSPSRVLLVGGGASAVPHAVLRADPTASADVLERTAAVVELGRDHFDTGLAVGRRDRVTVIAGNLDDAIAALDGSYDLVIVDARALEAVGGVAGLSRMARRRIPSLVRGGGYLVWGPTDASPLLPESAARWTGLRLWRRSVAGSDEATEYVSIARPGDETSWPIIVDFEPVPPR